MSIQVALSGNHYNNVIRMVLCVDRERAQCIRTATYTALKRLGLKRDLTKAVKKVPKGSDQWDTGSLLTWLDKIKPENKGAIQQLVAIDATACTRTA